MHERNFGNQEKRGRQISNQGFAFADSIHAADGTPADWFGSYFLPERNPIKRLYQAKNRLVGLDQSKSVNFYFTNATTELDPHKIQIEEKDWEGNRKPISAIIIDREGIIRYANNPSEQAQTTPAEIDWAPLTTKEALARLHQLQDSLRNKDWPKDIKLPPVKGEHDVFIDPTHLYKYFIESMVQQRIRVSLWDAGDKRYKIETFDGFHPSKDDRTELTEDTIESRNGVLVINRKRWNFWQGESPYFIKTIIVNKSRLDEASLTEEESASIKRLEAFAKLPSKPDTSETIALEGLGILRQWRQRLGLEDVQKSRIVKDIAQTAPNPEGVTKEPVGEEREIGDDTGGINLSGGTTQPTRDEQDWHRGGIGQGEMFQDPQKDDPEDYTRDNEDPYDER